ncbi:MAG: amidohydrolase family protein [Methanobrevibacter sp.]|uniref:amidohydrolase family protein n=1 Tax=Methanobrevibacter sp. TaxID=66852 RepID=UPI0026DF13B7|nr:amidohydrolase family protein [Methanobrevibacter sp.]MDO5848947.1 amidohydrolase family protein [Methanobrevibacter sp.]
MFTIANATILKGENLTPKKENIVVEDGKIIEINEGAFEGKIIDCEGCIVSPTFLNGHTHIGDSIIKDEGYGLTLDEVVKPPNGVKHVALSNADDDDIIAGMQDSMWEMIKTGTTHFIDYREGGIKGIELLKEASKDMPINPIILGRDNSFYGDDPDLKRVKKAIRDILKVADGIAPSGFGEITDEVANLITEECRKQSKISSIHVAESSEVQHNSLEKFNKTEVERAIDCNFDQIVHGTNLMKDDLKIISSSDVNLCLCPRANATLNVGIAPISDIVESDIAPILGSDNLMLNSPNMLRELEFTIKLVSVTQNYNINPRELLKMATTNVCCSSINQHIKKAVIREDSFAEFIVFKQKSKNPYLNIINRSNSKDILYIIHKNIIHKYQ